MTAREVAEVWGRLGELLEVPGELERLRNTVLELAVSGQLIYSADTSEDATSYVADIVERNKGSKPAKKLRDVLQPSVGVDHPKTWIRTMLGQISSDISYGTSLKTSDTGELPVLRMGNIQNSRLETNNLKFLPRLPELERLLVADGDILFNRTNSPALVGKSAVFHGDEPFTFASYLIRVRLDPQVDADFVNLWLCSPVGKAWAQRVKTDAIGQSNINGTSLGQFPLALPKRAEQVRIVETVAALFSRMDVFETESKELDTRRRRVIAAACTALVQRGERLLLDQASDLIRTSEDADQLERTVYGLAVTGRLVGQRVEDGDGQNLIASFNDQQDKRKRAAHNNIAEVNPPFNVPPNWSWTTLAVAGSIVGGGTPRSERSDCFARDVSSGIPWITPADLGGNLSMYVSVGRRSLTEEGLRSSSARLLPRGSVLFSSRAPIGYVAILDQPACTNQGFKSVIPHNGLLSEFVYIWLRYWAPEIDSAAPSTTFREVNKKSMEKQPIPIPPTAEQERIISKVRELLDAVNRLRRTTAA